MKTARGKRGGLRMSGLRSGWLGVSRRPVALSDSAGHSGARQAVNGGLSGMTAHPQPYVHARRFPVVRLIENIEQAVAVEVGDAGLVKPDPA